MIVRRSWPRSRLDVAGLIFVIALLLGAGRTVAAPPGTAPGASHYLLDHQGHLFAWIPDRPDLKPIPLSWPAVNDLAPISGGQRLLILADDPAEGDDRRGRTRGLAVVLDPTTSPPVAIHQIHFQGRGLRAAVADPHRAYLLAYRTGRAEQAREEKELGNAPRAWVSS